MGLGPPAPRGGVCSCRKCCARGGSNQVAHVCASPKLFMHMTEWMAECTLSPHACEDAVFVDQIPKRCMCAYLGRWVLTCEWYLVHWARFCDGHWGREWKGRWGMGKWCQELSCRGCLVEFVHYLSHYTLVSTSWNDRLILITYVNDCLVIYWTLDVKTCILLVYDTVHLKWKGNDKAVKAA